jgi:multiple sugar transport system ATP-binding protein
VSLLHAGREITALVPANRCPRMGEQVCFNVSMNDLHVFDAETGRSLVLRH